MTVDRLVLIRHAAPAIDRSQPASAWALSAAGRASCAALAATLAELGPAHLIASQELKARETAELTAAQLRIGWSTAAGLEEHARESVPWFDEPSQFYNNVITMFNNPDFLVFGEETASGAAARFAAAVSAVIAGWRWKGPPCVVAHGTVISLLVERWTGARGLDLWQRLGLPAVVVLDPASSQLIEVIDHVE